jgi:hypothetical protein
VLVSEILGINREVRSWKEQPRSEVVFEIWKAHRASVFLSSFYDSYPKFFARLAIHARKMPLAVTM